MNVMQPKDIRTLHPVASSKLSIFSSTQSFKPFPPRFTDLFNPKIITPPIRHRSEIKSGQRLAPVNGRFCLSNTGDVLMLPNNFSKQRHHGRRP